MIRKKRRIRSVKFILIAMISIFALFVQSVSAYADNEDIITSDGSENEDSNDNSSEQTETEENDEGSDSELDPEGSDGDDPSNTDENDDISETLLTEEACAEIVSVDLPTISEEGESPFDYILDPQFLIYETDAAAYGGGRVEEGASLLFRNHEGEYDFSSKSDRLTIRNRSNVSIKVTIGAVIENTDGVRICDSADFGENTECCMYLALMDDEGNECAITEGDGVKINVEMQKAPESAYTYSINEETGTYEVRASQEHDDSEFDTYSFALKGAINTDGEWQDIPSFPKVKITWSFEIIPDEESIGDKEIQKREILKDSDAEGNDTTEEGSDENAESEEESESDIENSEESADNPEDGNSEEIENTDEASDITTESQTGSSEETNTGETDPINTDSVENSSTESDATVSDNP